MQLATELSDGLRLSAVADTGGGGMGVNVAYLLGIYTALPEATF